MIERLGKSKNEFFLFDDYVNELKRINEEVKELHKSTYKSHARQHPLN